MSFPAFTEGVSRLRLRRGGDGRTAAAAPRDNKNTLFQRRGAAGSFAHPAEGPYFLGNREFLARGVWRLRTQDTDASYDHSYASEDREEILLCGERFQYESVSNSYFSAGGVGGATLEEETSLSGRWRVYQTPDDRVLLVAGDDETGQALGALVEIKRSVNGEEAFAIGKQRFQLVEQRCIP